MDFDHRMHPANLQRYVILHRDPTPLHPEPRRGRCPDSQTPARNAARRPCAGAPSQAQRARWTCRTDTWGPLKRWEEQLGGRTHHLGQGQSAQPANLAPSCCGQSGRRRRGFPPDCRAARRPERAFAVAFDDSAHVLTMYASHDDALASLRMQPHRHPAHCTWTSASPAAWTPSAH